MKSAIDNVTAFHRAVGQHVGDPTAPDISVDQKLRVDLIAEEFDELREALDYGETVSAADALADLVYVIVGSAVAWGIPLAEVFDEVHASNMTKIGGTRRTDGKIPEAGGISQAGHRGRALERDARSQVIVVLAIAFMLSALVVAAVHVVELVRLSLALRRRPLPRAVALPRRRR